MPLKISKFTGPGSTLKRRQFWDSIVDVVISERKLSGKHVVVTEDYGRASLIDVTPQRASPGGVICPTSITVQFSGVTFDCGCSLFFEGSEGSFLITDEGDSNSFVTLMGLGSLGSSCGDCAGLKWFSRSGFGLSPHVLISYWNEDSECSGPPTGTDFPEYFGLIMVLLSGTYYLVAYINFSLVFYGSTTNLNLPIANTLSCDLGFHDYSGDPAIACLFNGVLTPNLNSISHGGTATVTVL